MRELAPRPLGPVILSLGFFKLFYRVQHAKLPLDTNFEKNSQKFLYLLLLNIESPLEIFTLFGFDPQKRTNFQKMSQNPTSPNSYNPWQGVYKISSQ
jgi:hypothetical protein